MRTKYIKEINGMDNYNNNNFESEVYVGNNFISNPEHNSFQNNQSLVSNNSNSVYRDSISSISNQSGDTSDSDSGYDSDCSSFGYSTDSTASTVGSKEVFLNYSDQIKELNGPKNVFQTEYKKGTNIFDNTNKNNRNADMGVTTITMTDYESQKENNTLKDTSKPIDRMGYYSTDDSLDIDTEMMHVGTNRCKIM